MNELINFEKPENLEKEILDLVQDIPFGNSYAQTKSLINNALVPEKAFKVLGLRIMKRLSDLKTCSIKRRQVENEIKLLRYEISTLDVEYSGKPNLAKLHKERIGLLIQEKSSPFEYEEKLAKDLKAELAHLYSCIKKLPKYTREEFEKGDEEWVKVQLHATMNNLGTPVAPELAKSIEDGTINFIEERAVSAITLTTDVSK